MVRSAVEVFFEISFSYSTGKMKEVKVTRPLIDQLLSKCLGRNARQCEEQKKNIDKTRDINRRYNTNMACILNK